MAAPRNGRNVISRKMSIWVGHYEPLELFCLWTTKFTNFLLPNVERVVADQVFLRYSICRSVPEIFAIKVESCQKSGRNFDVLLALPNFFGGGAAFQKLYARYHACVAARRLEKFREDSPTSPDVIESYTLNFRPDF